MKKTKFTWIGWALVALLAAVLLVPACNQDQVSPTSPTGSEELSSRSALAPTTAPFAHGDSDSDDSESEDSDSESEDDDSESEDEDSESEDNGSDDDLSEDGVEGFADLNDDEARVRDLLFDADCPFTFTIGATVVMAGEGTRLDCEPGCNGQEEHLSADDFCAFLTKGLPMRARGTEDAGTIDASRVRIDDEIKATGVISAGSAALAPGVDFTLTVNGLALSFEVGLGAAIDVFGAGATVRVEGIVPPLAVGGDPTFIATEIQN